MLTRRQALGVAAGLALTGCGRLAAKESVASAGSSRMVLRTLKDTGGNAFNCFGAVPHLGSAFNASHTDVAVATGSGYLAGVPSVYRLETVDGGPVALYLGGEYMYPLDGAPKTANFDPSVLVPGQPGPRGAG